ncbi:4'-phosphopantetheinyl transferase superfamily protein [Telmatocola sphagniphila]|uniref:4'-phosphopantetheinyl transferase superfamily protein n=1 Tax=Telmatocola sphagniphila TaxID=1123043 RepID=A0A8E6BB89_9BACT|nr:4'-phosphopantetheinyl transferase superfamily protein [Telmatocola sphagniphila]QVL34689.1 4'-phosphopantetheinyl transferase superfamily protein [Telmatocola sphagniphila]
MKIITRPISEWTPFIELPDNEVHVWVAPLAENGSNGSHQRFLCEEELKRAEKFRSEKTRSQFISSRGTLRWLLSGYLGHEPEQVAITYEAAGKPILAGQPFYFNVTHSEEVAAYAVSKAGRVGLDIERLRTMENIESIIERFFTQNEFQAFQQVPLELKEIIFFRMWTRKEALLKAIGQGIHALELCEISVSPHEEPRVLKMMNEENCSDRWLLKDLDLAQGYQGALALELKP